jgi:iron(III) transport system permease protein
VSSTEFRTDRIRSITRSSLGIALWVVFCGVLAVVFVYPVFMVVFGAVHGDALPSWTEPLDFTGFVATFTSAATFKTLGNSLILVVACGSVATILGALFAWIGANTNVPLRRMLTPAMVIMLFLPPLFYTFGWEMLANVQNGLFNQILHSWGLPRGVLNIETWAGLIFTLSLGFTPFTYMLMIGAFANRDQALDEAAQISGSGVFRTFFTVTIPSVGPAIVGAATLVFILIFQAFDSPQILGRPAGITVFSTEIYHDVQGVVPGAYSTAFSLALVMIAIVVILFVGQRLLLRGRSFTTLTGKSARRGTQQLGRVRGVFTAVIVLFIILNLVLPLGAVILGSLEPIFGVLGALTFDNYVQVFTDPRLTSSLVLTVQFAIIGGLIAMAVAVLTSYVVIRRSGFLRGFTSFALWIPWALPGVVTALAYLWSILTIPGANKLYGTQVLLVLVLIVATIPLCVRLSEGALVQLSPELEQAGRVAGAGAARVFFTIVLRLLVPSFLAGWFLSALFITGNLSVPILLAPPGFEPVSIAAFHLFLDGNTAAGAALFVVILAGAAVVLAVAGIVLAVLRRVKARQATQISVAPESQGVPAVPIT